MNVLINDSSKIRNVIILLSVLIPLVVAVLIFFPQSGKLGDFDVSFLPHLNGILNTATSVCLLAGFYFIKNKNEAMHRNMMVSAVFLSIIFLVSYVLYHYQSEPTIFGGEGIVKYLYYFVLITHIILAVVVVPFVLFAIFYAISGQRIKHKRIVKFTFPIWLYVAVTGVVVYLMISPYY